MQTLPHLPTVPRLMLGFSLLLWLSGCTSLTRSNDTGGGTPPPSTGRVLTSIEVQQAAPGILTGNLAYAEVNSAWLERWYESYRNELFRLGVVHWDQRFDCNRFANFYVGFAQAAFYREMFQRATRADALALGPMWYVRDDGRGGHAVIQALTNEGRVFIDPQTGRHVELSSREIASAYLQYF